MLFLCAAYNEKSGAMIRKDNPGILGRIVGAVLYVWFFGESVGSILTEKRRAGIMKYKNQTAGCFWEGSV